MEKNQISINLESVQDRMSGTKQIVDTLSKLKLAGYDYVEILHCQNPDDGSTWRTILDDCGLKASSTHELFDDIKKDPEAVIRKANDLGCRYIAAGLAQSTVWEDQASVKKLIAELNTFGRLVKSAGLQCLYHNHNMEFYKSKGASENCLETIFNETDPEAVGAELDIYWVQLSGASPIYWCNKLQERLKALHLKDLGVTGGSFDHYIKTPVPVTLGDGNLDFSSIVKAADSVGCEWYIVETHTNWVDGDSIKTAELSYNYLLKHFC